MADFSGYIAADELYDGPFCVLFIVDILDNNRLTDLPESLGKLQNLTTFELHDNQFTDLPESVGKLTNLQNLYRIFGIHSGVPLVSVLPHNGRTAGKQGYWNGYCITNAQVVKNITARELFKRFPGIKRHLWGGALWERGCFVISFGTGTTDEMIRQYIKEQCPQSDANDLANVVRP